MTSDVVDERIYRCCVSVIDFLLDDTEDLYNDIGKFPLLIKMNCDLNEVKYGMDMSGFAIMLNDGVPPWGENSPRDFFSDMSKSVPFFIKFIRDYNINKVLK